MASVKDLNLLKQVHFSGEANCQEFKPHWLRPNFCVECNKLFDKHKPELIPSDEALIKAISYSQSAEKVPSAILSPTDNRNRGGLYLGGFRGVMNEAFLKESNIKFIVNTAKGLEIFGPKYLDAVRNAKEQLGVTILELNWEDHEGFVIPNEDLMTSCLAIHKAITSGYSVLVHCAQGKSRSSTAVIVYLMASKGMSSSVALSTVQEIRPMAQPNPAFMKKLQELDGSGIIREIRVRMAE